MKRIAASRISALLAVLMILAPSASCSRSPRPEEVPAAAEITEGEGIGAAPTEETRESQSVLPAEESGAPWSESKRRLCFSEDGEFRILVFSDIHGPGTKVSALAKNNIALLVEREEPDFVFFDGDNTWGLKDEETLRSCVEDMTEILEEKHIPWAHVYGNHDAEGDNLPKEKQQQIYESFDYCVSLSADPSLPGVGNYVLPVYASDGRAAFAVWALDSGQYITSGERADLEPVGTVFQGYAGSVYDYIRPAQIAWYRETSAAMEEYAGGKIPGASVRYERA